MRAVISAIGILILFGSAADAASRSEDRRKAQARTQCRELAADPRLAPLQDKVPFRHDDISLWQMAIDKSAGPAEQQALQALAENWMKCSQTLAEAFRLDRDVRKDLDGKMQEEKEIIQAASRGEMSLGELNQRRSGFLLVFEYVYSRATKKKTRKRRDAQEAGKTAGQKAYAQAQSYCNSLISDPRLRPLHDKMQFYPRISTIRLVSIREKADSAEKEALVVYAGYMRDCARAYLNYYSRYSPDLWQAHANLLVRRQNAMLSAYKGEISFGQLNDRLMKAWIVMLGERMEALEKRRVAGPPAQAVEARKLLIKSFCKAAAVDSRLAPLEGKVPADPSDVTIRQKAIERKANPAEKEALLYLVKAYRMCLGLEGTLYGKWYIGEYKSILNEEQFRQESIILSAYKGEISLGRLNALRHRSRKMFEEEVSKELKRASDAFFEERRRRRAWRELQRRQREQERRQREKERNKTIKCQWYLNEWVCREYYN